LYNIIWDEILTKLDGLPESSRLDKAVRDKIYKEILVKIKMVMQKLMG